jgi:penicillin V acylase-like amidase (Ntn superfamily)
MLKKIIGSLFLMICFVTTQACTTFLLHHNGQLAFGRNYDWMADAGMVCTNLRGLAKTSLKNEDGATVSWVSRYGSITFNQYGKEMPTGGMNEQGLVVELMWLDGTVYPKPDQRPSIGVLQWIQYQLDNSATIDEVIATDSKLRIASTGTPLHYLVADARGNAATIEFLNGKMVVHKGGELPFPVLTNDTYEQSVKSKNNQVSASDHSLQRFSTACNMIQQYKASPGNGSVIDRSFEILDKVSQGEFTKWSIVYDITNKKIYFKTEQFPEIRSLLFSSFDFSCKESPKTINMNVAGKGDISANFSKFSTGFNQQIVEKTLEQSSPHIVLSREQKEGLLAYPATIHCQ